MPVDVYAALEDLVRNILSSESTAVQFTEAPADAFVAAGVTDEDLSEVDLDQLVTETASELDLPASTQQALAAPAAGGPVSPPSSDGPLTLEQATQHLNFVSFTTHQSEEILQNISNQQFSFDNSEIEIEDESVNVDGDLFAAGGDIEDVVSGDDNQVVSGDDNVVGGGDLEGVATGDGALAAGDDIEGVALGDGSVAAGGDVANAATGEDSLIIDGDNSGQANTGDNVQQAGDDLNQLDNGSVLVDGEAGAVNTGTVNGVQAGDDATNAIVGDQNTANQVADSELEGVAFGDGNATNAELEDVEIEDGALGIGDGFADNVSDVEIDDGAVLNTGGGTATGSNQEIDSEVDIDDSFQDNSQQAEFDDSFNEVDVEVEGDEPIEAIAAG